MSECKSIITELSKDQKTQRQPYIDSLKKLEEHIPPSKRTELTKLLKWLQENPEASVADKLTAE